MADALKVHDATVRTAIDAHDGYVFGAGVVAPASGRATPEARSFAEREVAGEPDLHAIRTEVEHPQVGAVGAGGEDRRRVVPDRRWQRHERVPHALAVGRSVEPLRRAVEVRDVVVRTEVAT